MNLKQVLGISNGIKLGQVVINQGGGVSAPAAPTGLTATPVSTSQIDLAWTDAATSETAYRVYRSTDGVTYAQVGTDLAAGTQAYSDTTIDDGISYWYKVSAVNAGGETPSSAAQTNTLLMSIASYWKLDEFSAGLAAITRSDSVGGMTLADASFVASDTGIVGNGVNFPGGKGLAHADDPVLQMGDINFTIAAWVKPGALTGYPTLVSKDNTGGTRDYALVIGYPTTQKFGFQVAITGTTKNLANTTALSAGEWYLVIAWHDKTADKIYLQVNNGTPAELATGGALANPSTNAFSLGISGGNSLTGILDEAGIWKRLLTVAERSELWNEGAGRQYPFNGSSSSPTTPIPMFAVGDSITVGTGDELSDGGWFTHLMLSVTGATEVTRYATSGYTVHDTKLGIDAALAALSTTPEYVFIYLGANDVASMPAEVDYKADMNYVLDAIHTKWADAPIYVGTGSRPGGAVNYATLVTWNATCLTGRAYCHAGASYGDVFAGNEATLISGDNVHPNHAGHVALAAANKTLAGL